MMKVAITGAGGYIGRHVLNRLKEMQLDVTAVVYPGSTIGSDTKSIELDILNTSDEVISNAFGGFDAVLHLAWTAGFNHHDPIHIENVMKHYHFLKALIKAGITNISVAGTMHEVGYHVGEINEHTACNPSNPYGIAKNFLRQMCMYEMQKSNVHIKWLRMYYITGDDSHSNSIFSKILMAEYDGKKTFPLNSGEMLYDFITIEQLAEQISMAVVQTDITGVINCCTGKPRSLRTLVESFIRDNDLSIIPEYNVFPVRDYDSPALWGSSVIIDKIMRDVRNYEFK